MGEWWEGQRGGGHGGGGLGGPGEPDAHACGNGRQRRYLWIGYGSCSLDGPTCRPDKKIDLIYGLQPQAHLVCESGWASQISHYCH